MGNEKANAFPRKRFFIDMFTRDISLEDCMLDLIDNSIDGYLRSNNIAVSDVVSSFLKGKKTGKKKSSLINITVNEKEIIISDNCGGISYKDAKDHIFNFGHSVNDKQDGQLGVYGVGLKRAIFKMGTKFTVESKMKSEGFRVDEDINEWVKKDEKIEDWFFNLEKTNASRGKEAGTVIHISNLTAETGMRVKNGLKDNTLIDSLQDAIERTYALFLDSYVEIKLNKQKIKPFKIAMATSDVIRPMNNVLDHDKVKIQIITGLQEKDDKGNWKTEKSGWYVLCNGRVVVTADKTELGWGGLSPLWQPKHRGFIGLIFFQSKDPLLLPWTTTKRGINKESIVYQKIKNEMALAAKPVLDFLSKMYPSAEEPEAYEKEMAKSIKPVEISKFASKQNSDFIVQGSKKVNAIPVTKINYSVSNSDYARVRKALEDPDISPKEVGERTFKYYLEAECP